MICFPVVRRVGKSTAVSFICFRQHLHLKANFQSWNRMLMGNPSPSVSNSVRGWTGTIETPCINSAPTSVMYNPSLIRNCVTNDIGTVINLCKSARLSPITKFIFFSTVSSSSPATTPIVTNNRRDHSSLERLDHSSLVVRLENQSGLGRRNRSRLLINSADCSSILSLNLASHFDVAADFLKRDESAPTLIAMSRRLSFGNLHSSLEPFDSLTTTKDSELFQHKMHPIWHRRSGSIESWNAFDDQDTGTFIFSSILLLGWNITIKERSFRCRISFWRPAVSFMYNDTNARNSTPFSFSFAAFMTALNVSSSTCLFKVLTNGCSSFVGMAVRTISRIAVLFCCIRSKISTGSTSGTRNFVPSNTWVCRKIVSSLSLVFGLLFTSWRILLHWSLSLSKIWTVVFGFRFRLSK